MRKIICLLIIILIITGCNKVEDKIPKPNSINFEIKEEVVEAVLTLKRNETTTVGIGDIDNDLSEERSYFQIVEDQIQLNIAPTYDYAKIPRRDFKGEIGAIFIFAYGQMISEIGSISENSMISDVQIFNFPDKEIPASLILIMPVKEKKLKLLSLENKSIDDYTIRTIVISEN